MIEDMMTIHFIAVDVGNASDESASIEQGIGCCSWTGMAKIKLSIIRVKITFQSELLVRTF